MPVPNMVSGKVGKGRIGSIVIHLSKWTVDDEADDLDATTAEDDGYGVADTGVEQVSGNVEGWYTIGQTALGHMVPGRGTNLRLYTYLLGADVGPYWDIPNFAISNLQHGSEVRGRINFSFRFKSRGAFTRPLDPA